MLWLGSILRKTGQWYSQKASHTSLSLGNWVYHPYACIHVRLLGPCYKTGRPEPFRQHPKDTRQSPLRQGSSDSCTTRRCKSPDPRVDGNVLPNGVPFRPWPGDRMEWELNRRAKTQLTFSQVFSKVPSLCWPAPYTKCTRRCFPDSKIQGMCTSPYLAVRIYLLNGARPNTGYARFPFNNFKHF